MINGKHFAENNEKVDIYAWAHVVQHMSSLRTVISVSCLERNPHTTEVDVAADDFLCIQKLRSPRSLSNFGAHHEQKHLGGEPKFDWLLAKCHFLRESP